MEKKGKMSVVLIYGILFLVYNVLFFSLPLRKITATWVCYAFSFFAFIISFFISKYAFKNTETLESKVYGFPVFQVGAIYLIVQLIFGFLMHLIGGFAEVPTWVAVFICTLLVGTALVGTIAADEAKEIVQEIQKETIEKTKRMTKFHIDVIGLEEDCTDKVLAKRLRHFIEEVRYSDPVSSEELEEIEAELGSEIKELKAFLKEGNYQKAENSLGKAEILLLNRNQQCKLLK